MTEHTYKLVESVDGFSEDEILDVTARFGDWHHYDVKLESREETESRSVELTTRHLKQVAEPVSPPA